MVNIRNTLVGLVLAGASLFSGCTMDNYVEMERKVRDSAYLTAESFANSDLPKRNKSFKVINSKGFSGERTYFMEDNIDLSMRNIRGGIISITGEGGKYVAIDKNSIELGVHKVFHEPYLWGQKITLSSNNIEIISYPMVIEYKKVGEEWKKSTSQIIDTTHDKLIFRGLISYELKPILKNEAVKLEEVERYIEFMERIRQKAK